ncbi:hypothetical protein DOTSEDRAFT_50745 [Dothistroma septosporum NZE10]|uniref:Major facilitator superfamily (MFS) profile domain-containing protein n=1 Tax=Dothistroma septosporum (strain NZE10 / CBS 128990) TaxID=675120 RepID=N1PYK3_DOTSN|nr:hypothetical protein DOTSEDRAFT_50745 [Dothistroma septosporum NZE10]
MVDAKHSVESTDRRAAQQLHVDIISDTEVMKDVRAAYHASFPLLGQEVYLNQQQQFSLPTGLNVFALGFANVSIVPISNICARRSTSVFFWLSAALAGFVTVILIFCYPETKFHRAPLGQLGQQRKGKNGTAVQEMGAENSEANSQSKVFDGQHVRRGRPGKRTYLDLQHMAENPQTVGYSSFAIFCGGIFGVLTAGLLSDWWTRRMTTANSGIREAEFWFSALWPYCCSLLMWHVSGAVGYQSVWPWQAIAVCGFGFSDLAVTSTPAIAIAYAIDCYKPISEEIMVVGTVLKNVLGFCLSH